MQIESSSKRMVEGWPHPCPSAKRVVLQYEHRKARTRARAAAAHQLAVSDLVDWPAVAYPRPCAPLLGGKREPVAPHHVAVHHEAHHVKPARNARERFAT
eukprot:4781049-Pleurochrysis_carterae.AAC.4